MFRARPFAGRGFCGRGGKGYLLPHRCAYYHGGGLVAIHWHPGRLWDLLHGRKGIYVCYKPDNHWKLTLVPEREKMMRFIDRRPQEGHKKASPYRKDWPTIMYPVPIRSVELGHRFTFNRYEVRLPHTRDWK